MAWSDNDGNTLSPEAQRRWFTTTHWSVVLAAREGDAPGASAALEKLCRTYWPPLYAYIQREGYDPTEAEDLTQEFFGRLLEKRFLRHLHDQRGKFRSFLLTFLKHFLSDHRRRAQTQKRGGGKVHFSLDVTGHDAGYLIEVADELTPDEVFQRRWAQTVMQTALNRLRAEFAAREQSDLFERLQDHQPHEPEGKSYAQLGEEFGMTEAAIKSAAQRMRQRHRQLLREEIAHTVTHPEDIDDELRHFQALFARDGR